MNRALVVVVVLVAQLCLTLATPWTVACRPPLSMEFSRQEYWNGLPFPSLGDLPNPGIEHRSPALQADSLLTELQGKAEEQSILKILIFIYCVVPGLHCGMQTLSYRMWNLVP